MDFALPMQPAYCPCQSTASLLALSSAVSTAHATAVPVACPAMLLLLVIEHSAAAGSPERHMLIFAGQSIHYLLQECQGLVDTVGFYHRLT